MKEDIKNEVYGKNVTKDVFCKLNYRLPRLTSNRDFFNILKIYDGQMKGGKTL
jgi:hypothetical protein